ncbi:MAG: hypothetical protein AABZ39_05265 [Spirochaetota bacterium]
MTGIRVLIAFAVFLPLAAQTKIAEWNCTAGIPENMSSYINTPGGAAAIITHDASADTPTGRGALKITITKGSLSESDSDVQLSFVHKDGLVKGKKYRVAVTLRAQRSLALPVRLSVIQNTSPWAAVNAPFESYAPNGRYSLPKREWETISLRFTAAGDCAREVRAPCVFLGMLDTGSIIWIESVLLESMD